MLVLIDIDDVVDAMSIDFVKLSMLLLDFSCIFFYLASRFVRYQLIRSAHD